MKLIKKIAIIGPGKVGTALGNLIYNSRQYQVTIAGRDKNKTQDAANFIGPNTQVMSIPEAVKYAHIVLLTVPDDEIQSLCEKLSEAKLFPKGAVIAHCSGALPSSILASAKKKCECLIASMHPLQTFPDIDSAIKNLPGTYCFYEGQTEALGIIEHLIKVLQLNPIVIDEQAKTLYHAAAVMACNYLSTLMDAALELGQQANIEPKVLWHALSPLVFSTLNNVNKTSPAEALTGPIARGDKQTISQHLNKISAITAKDSDLLEIYMVMGKQTVDLALKKGSITPATANEIKALLRKTNSSEMI